MADEENPMSLMRFPNELVELIARQLVTGDEAYDHGYERRRRVTDLSSLVRTNRHLYCEYSNLLYHYNADTVRTREQPDHLTLSYGWPFTPMPHLFMTAMTYAAYHGCLETARRVMEATPDICLMAHVTIALQRGHLDIARLLLDMDTVAAQIATRNDKIVQKKATSEDGRVFEDGDHPIFEAVMRGDLGIVQKILGTTTSPDFYHGNRDLMGRQSKSPLHLACEYGHLNVVRFLLACGADPDGQVPRESLRSNTTPLGLALKGKHRHVVAELVGRWPRLLQSSYNFCRALEWGDDEVVDMFFQAGASVHPVQPDNELIPLHAAIAGGNVAVVKRMLDLGVDVGSIMQPAGSAGGRGTWYGWGAEVKWAMKVVARHAGNPSALEMARLLLSRNAQVLNLKMDAGVSILTDVLKADNVELARLFLQHVTPEAVATSLGFARSPEMMQLLLDHGADVDRNATGSLTRAAPLEICVSGAAHDQANESGDICAAVEFLAERTRDVNSTTYFGRTALHALCLLGRRGPGTVPEAGSDARQLKLLRILLKHGANPNLKDHFGQSALHEAAATGSPEVVKTLLEHGADLHLTDQNGGTPLHRAVAENRFFAHRSLLKEVNFGVIEVLLSHGADGQAVNGEKVPALHFTRGLSRGSVAHLVALGADPALLRER